MLLTLAERWGGDTGAYPAFADGYGESMADDVTTRRFAELRNVAATLMRCVPGALIPSRDRRLSGGCATGAENATRPRGRRSDPGLACTYAASPCVPFTFPLHFFTDA